MDAKLKCIKGFLGRSRSDGYTRNQQKSKELHRMPICYATRRKRAKNDEGATVPVDPRRIDAHLQPVRFGHGGNVEERKQDVRLLSHRRWETRSERHGKVLQGKQR